MVKTMDKKSDGFILIELIVVCEETTDEYI
jgi:hypothetical protein